MSPCSLQRGGRRIVFGAGLVGVRVSVTHSCVHDMNKWTDGNQICVDIKLGQA